MSNEALVLETLLEIKSQLGEVHATTNALSEKLTRHVEDDEVTAERVRTLELAQAKERGARKTWAVLGTAVATVAGLVVGWVRGG